MKGQHGRLGTRFYAPHILVKDSSGILHQRTPSSSCPLSYLPRLLVGLNNASGWVMRITSPPSLQRRERAFVRGDVYVSRLFLLESPLA